MSKPGEKTLFEQHVKCPYCSRPIITRVVKKTISPSVKGQTEILGYVEKDSQSTLEEDYQASLKKGKKQAKRKGISDEWG